MGAASEDISCRLAGSSVLGRFASDRLASQQMPQHFSLPWLVAFVPVALCHNPGACRAPRHLNRRPLYSTSKVSSSRPPPGSLLRRHSTSGVACPGSPAADLDSRSLVPRPQLKVHVKTIGRTHRSDSTVRSRCTHDRQAPASRHATPSLVRLLSPASHTSCSLAV